MLLPPWDDSYPTWEGRNHHAGLYAGVVRSMTLYGAPILVDALTVKTADSHSGESDTRLPRTVSWTAVTLPANDPPWDLQAEMGGGPGVSISRPGDSEGDPPPLESLQEKATHLLNGCFEDIKDLFFKHAIDCIAVIIYKHVPCGTLITVISTTTHTEPLNRLLSDKNCYNFIERSIQTQKWLISSDVYIMSLKNSSQLYSSLKELSRDTAWNPTAQFIIIIYDSKWSEYDENFKLLLKFNIYNILLITNSENGGFKLITYNPFKKNSCGKSFDKIISKINNCEVVDTIRVNYKHLEDKFRNCTITIAALEYVPHFMTESNKEYAFLGKKLYGIEQQMLANIAERENITLKYIIKPNHNDPGVVLPNFTVTGFLNYLQNDSASIVAGGYAQMKNRLEIFDCICGYGYGTLFLFTPVRSDISWKTVYRPFSVTTWSLICLSFVFVSIATILISRYFGEGKLDKNLPLKLWGYIFGNTSYKLSRLKKLRMVVIVWIWFTFLISSFYSTALYSLITAPETRQETFTPNNLGSLPLKPCISNGIFLFFKNTYNFSFFEKSPSKCQQYITLDIVANSDLFYTIEIDYKYYIRKFKYIDDKGNNKLKKDRFGNDVMFAMYTKKGFPLLNKFQKYAHYHFETGLLKKQLETIYHWYNIRETKHIGHTFKVIVLSEFRVHFSILFLGYMLSFICFIIELNKSYLKNIYYI
ncbi:uncharacterized protein LOC126770401 [Nymphalis io]|uniref:uncharacterized protein LOC126770401 n=1 Tax=Inachis io TaxID=171585 RepID=UPI002169F9B3|nr:uncharacterized protein LOC126770401 [Nymphalis io]